MSGAVINNTIYSVVLSVVSYKSIHLLKCTKLPKIKHNKKTPSLPPFKSVSSLMMQNFIRFPGNLDRKSELLEANSVKYQNHKKPHITQTCIRPPLKSTWNFGMVCSGPGLPLCLHHLASTLAKQLKGPMRVLLLSLRLVLRRKLSISSTKDDPWMTPEKEK